MILWIQTMLLATVTFAAPPDAQKNQAVWNQQMRSLSQALADIVPDLFKPDPTTPTDIKTLQKKSSRLLKAAKNIDLSHKHGLRAPDQDPSLVFLSEMFREEIEFANKGIQQGFYGYSKTLLKSSVTYCIACHTRTDSGPQFPVLDAFKEPLKKASWLERIKFEAATRQFDGAYREVMTKIDDPQLSPATRLELDSAVKIALSIAVRVKKSPEQALLICKNLLKSSNISESLKDNARIWQNDLQKWQKEKTTTASDKQLIAKAQELIAWTPTKSYTPVPGGEIRYLRATDLMHTLLKEHPQSALATEALYIIGLSYEAIDELSYWGLHEKYYERCIHNRPHSPLAQSCFGSLKNSVELGYSGSSGTRVPSLVSERLATLEKLAKP